MILLQPAILGRMLVANEQMVLTFTTCVALAKCGAERVVVLLGRLVKCQMEPFVDKLRRIPLSVYKDLAELLAVITEWTVKDVLIVAVYVEVMRVTAQRYPRNTPISRQQVVLVTLHRLLHYSQELDLLNLK